MIIFDFSTLLLIWLFFLYCVWAFEGYSKFLNSGWDHAEFIGITLHPKGEKCTINQWKEGTDKKINIFLWALNYSFYADTSATHLEETYYRHFCYFRILPFIWLKFFVDEC